MNFIYNTPISIKLPNIPFRSLVGIQKPQGKAVVDGFTSNPIYENFGTKAQIEATAKSNPRIREILAEHKIPLEVNIEELNKLKQGHMQDTRVVAAKIYSSLPAEMKKQLEAMKARLA